MKELETYEDRNSKARGQKGPIHLTRQNDYALNDIRNRWNAAAKKLGYEVGDYNGPRQNYFADSQKNVRSGVRQSTDDVYLKPVMGKRSNLHVIMFSHVTRILFSGNTAFGVEYSRNGRLCKVMARKEVILSASALASPQILMLSGIGPKRQLQKFNIKVSIDLPGVGQNLEDHVRTFAKFSTNQSYPKNAYITKKNYRLWKSQREGIFASSLSCSFVFSTSNYSIDSNDTQITAQLYIARDAFTLILSVCPYKWRQPEFIAVDLLVFKVRIRLTIFW